MVLDFYNLREQPFGVNPDPRYLYLSRTHREALATLVYGIETGRGFLALVASPGMGKTTLLFRLLERLRGSARTVFLFQTQCNSLEFFRYLLIELGIDKPEPDFARMCGQLNEALFREIRARKKFALVIDEVQNLEEPVLETIRLLSNFETPQAKLVQIVLAGQPQFADKLAKPCLMQLRQRIATLSRLSPFIASETAEYISHRLRTAGYHGGPLFTSRALAMVQEWSQGIPRNINNLCFQALSLGSVLKCKTLDSKIVQEVLDDMTLESQIQKAQPAGSPNFLASPKVTVPISGSVAKGHFGDPAFRPWTLALVIALAVLLSFTFSLGLLKSRRVQWFPAAVRAHASAPVAGPQETSDLTNHPPGALQAERGVGDPEYSQPRIPSTFTVIVKRHQTLRQISLHYLRRFDEDLLKEILKLNPQLTDPNQIPVGERIRLPAPEAIPPQTVRRHG